MDTESRINHEEEEKVFNTLEKSFTPSRAKLRKPKTEVFAGDMRCCVLASKLLSTTDEIPETKRSSRIRV